MPSLMHRWKFSYPTPRPTRHRSDKNRANETLAFWMRSVNGLRKQDFRWHYFAKRVPTPTHNVVSLLLCRDFCRCRLGFVCNTDVCCLLVNVPATCECISGTDLLRQFYVLPHWDRSSSNFPSHPVTVYWHRANQSQHWPYIARFLAG